MIFTEHYDSPLGGILLAADEIGLTGLWLDGQKYFGDTLPKEYEEKSLPVFEQSVHWLDIYFSGKAPDFTPPLFCGVRLLSSSKDLCCNGLTRRKLLGSFPVRLRRSRVFFLR